MRGQRTCATLGLRENALYLIRPDTYVALALPAPSVDAVEHYLAKVQINPSDGVNR